MFAISFPEPSFPLTSGRKTRALGATILCVRRRCRLRCETGSEKLGYFLCFFFVLFFFSKRLLPESLVKGNEDFRNEIFVCTSNMHTAISKKVAPVIHDA